MKFDDRLDTVLVIDDEPLNTEWLFDYLGSEGFKVESVKNLQQALSEISKKRFRFVIIDLNIPFEASLRNKLQELGPHFLKYPGLMAARAARTSGHNTFQVVVFSVHDSEEVRKYVELIRATYIIKGRPRELKTHIETWKSKEPHGWRSIQKDRSA
ncbi:MAG TPA: response regulator [Xanthobacteraceae bacterium]|nr:response regulator [Xanthobacteraceae bacterium]